MDFPITKVCLGDAERKLIAEVLDSGWLVQGQKTAEFEKMFSAMLGGGEAVAVSSCTAALHLLMLTLELRPGDEVLVPAFTWIATANAVELVGGKPVFVDVDPLTFNVRPEALTAAITPRTVGILAVHLFGRCADLDAINAIASRHGLWVVEDAACAVGSLWRNRPAGRLARAGAFSFHPRKSITTGEGGMIVTEDPALAAACRSLRNHGAAATMTAGAAMPDFTSAGLNYRLTDLQAALGLGQLPKLPAFIADRRAQAEAYRVALGGTRDLILPSEPAESFHTYQSFVVLLAANGELPPDSAVEREGAARDALLHHLAAAGVGCRPGTHAPVLTSYYRDRYRLRPEDFPGAWRADRLSLALPLYPGLGDDGVSTVAKRLQHALQDVGSPA